MGMKNIPADDEPVMSENNKIKSQPPEGKMMYTLRRVLVVASFLQGIRNAWHLIRYLANLIKEWSNPS